MYDINQRDKLPQNVQDMPAKEQAAWVATWNNVYQECQKDGGDDCEGKAFAVANGNAEMANRTLSEENRQALQVAHKTIGDILDKQNAKETPETNAPGYRLAMAGGDNCSTCANMQDGKCQLYDMATSKKYTCDSHEAMPMSEMETDKVLMLGMAQLTYLSEPTAKWFVGLVFGKQFTDMNGRTVSFPEKSKEKYLSNTLRAIEATRTESGELVGLPIDEGGHSKGKSAGRIVGAKLGTLQNGNKTYTVMRLLANWTPIGIELISNNITRGFSPTVNPSGEVLLGGSMTNWPASTEDDGVGIMPPVELSQPAEESDMGMTDEDKAFFKEMLTTAVTGIKTEFDEKLAALKPQLDKTDLSQDGEELDPKAVELSIERQRKRDEAVDLAARRKLEAGYRVEAHKNRVIELSASLINGTPKAPRGLPIQATELEARLVELPQEQLPFWQNLLTTIQEKGLLDFSELGHGRVMKGTKQLPAGIPEDLDSGELKLTDLSNPILGLGDLSQYDLSKWQGGK